MFDVLEKPETRQMLYRLSKEQYHRLTEGTKTELVRGVIFQKMSKSPLHANFLQLLFDLLRPKVPASCHLVMEKPLSLGDSELEPDLAIVNKIQSMHEAHPTTAYLVAEISVTTQTYDEAKGDVYAEAQIPIYWQILPLEKVTTVYRNPQGGRYTSIVRVPFSDGLDVHLPERQFSLRLSSIP